MAQELFPVGSSKRRTAPERAMRRPGDGSGLCLAICIPPLIRSAPVTYLSRYLVCAALFVGASTVLASSGAPNVQVNVKQGRTTIFTAITDASGRFTTVPVEPGVYTFELRVLKTAPPAHYFLILSGAKPVTAAMADKDAVLMMDAQVRTARSVTGQVTARRLRIAAPAGTTPTTTQPAAVPLTPTPAATPTAFLSRSQATAVGRTAAPARVAVPARMVTRSRAGTLTPPPAPMPAASTRAAAPALVARPAVAAPAQVSAPPRASRPAVAAPMRSAAPARVAAPTRVAAPAASSAPRQAAPVSARPPSGLVPRPAGEGTKIINGVPHVWAPIAPGSTLGRWVPGRR